MNTLSRPPLLLGCIADDVTGATDLALALGRHGMNVIQVLGQPQQEAPPTTDAVVIALKTRTAPVTDAVSQSLAAARWLQDQGARQLFFKYCSTFDSRSDGNIGPVAEALLDFVKSDFTIVCPAFPENGRTVYQGHLFVGSQLLSESGMQHHPLNPMTDPNLVRVLARQCRSEESVGIVPLEVVDRGPEPIREAYRKLRGEDRRFAIVDAVKDDHLASIAEASSNLPLVTGGSAVAMALPENFRRNGDLAEKHGLAPLPRLEGKAAIISGSCSSATQEQVREVERLLPSYRLDTTTLAEDGSWMPGFLSEVRQSLSGGPVLVYSTAPPLEVAAIQDKLGGDAAGELIERALAEVAVELVAAGVTKLIVAGGETSGAVADALGVSRLSIGPEIDTGVPWTIHVDPPSLLLAFKSGNFGGVDFFRKALEMIS